MKYSKIEELVLRQLELTDEKRVRDLRGRIVNIAEMDGEDGARNSQHFTRVLNQLIRQRRVLWRKNPAEERTSRVVPLSPDEEFERGLLRLPESPNPRSYRAGKEHLVSAREGRMSPALHGERRQEIQDEAERSRRALDAALRDAQRWTPNKLDPQAAARSMMGWEDVDLDSLQTDDLAHLAYDVIDALSRRRQSARAQRALARVGEQALAGIWLSHRIWSGAARNRDLGELVKVARKVTAKLNWAKHYGPLNPAHPFGDE